MLFTSQSRRTHGMSARNGSCPPTFNALPVLTSDKFFLRGAGPAVAEDVADFAFIYKTNEKPYILGKLRSAFLRGPQERPESSPRAPESSPRAPRDAP